MNMGNIQPLYGEANWLNDTFAVNVCLQTINKNIVWVPLNFTHQINIIRIINSMEKSTIVNEPIVKLFINVFQNYFSALTGKKPLIINLGPGKDPLIIHLNDSDVGYKPDGTTVFPNGCEKNGLPLHDGSAMLAFFFSDLIKFKDIYIKMDTTSNEAGRVLVKDESQPDNSYTKVKLAVEPSTGNKETIHQIFSLLLLHINNLCK